MCVTSVSWGWRAQGLRCRVIVAEGLGGRVYRV